MTKPDEAPGIQVVEYLKITVTEKQKTGNNAATTEKICVNQRV